MMDAQDGSKSEDMDNIFSQPWSDSDVVLAVEDKEFHVHRSILSLQSPVFKAMFDGKFNDATQDRIELKDDNYEDMLQFLILLYPQNMLDVEDDYERIDLIDDTNVFEIVEIADKYGAKNVTKQCMKAIDYDICPANAMRLLPYAIRNELSFESIFNAIKQHVSEKKLKNFAPELNNDSVYAEALAIKCRNLENITMRANGMLLYFLDTVVKMVNSKDKDSDKISVKCPKHQILAVKDFKKARKCRKCLKAYREHYVDKCVFPGYDAYDFAKSRQGQPGRPWNPSRASTDLIDLLKLTDDIVTSLES